MTVQGFLPAYLRFLRLLIGGGLLVVWGAVQATNLYEVTVPVLDQSGKERRLALQEALNIVLVRASGLAPGVLQATPELSLQQARPEDYLLEYRYLLLPEKPSVVAESTAAEGEKKALTAMEAASLEPQSTALLSATFSPALIRNVLQKAGLPLWPSSRPAILVWWQVEVPDQGTGKVGRSLSNMNTFTEEAKRRGMPVILPMGDGQDQKDLDGLWRFDETIVERVAERYGIQAILVGRAVMNPGGWNGQWLFYFHGKSMVFPAALQEGFPAPWQSAASRQALEEAGVQLAVGELLKHYALDLSAGEHEINLVVSGVERFRAYTETSQYLQSLEPVSAVTLSKAEGTSQTYQLRYAGSLDVLKELISLSGILVSEEAPQNPVSESVGELSVNAELSTLLTPVPETPIEVTVPEEPEPQVLTLYYHYKPRF